MRTWGNGLAAAQAESGPLVLLDGKNRDVYNTVYIDNTLDGGSPGSAAVPASLKLILDYQPVRTTLNITLAGVSASLMEWGSAPGSVGIVAVNWTTGELLFHPSDLAKLVVGSYKHYGTVLDAHTFNRLQVAVAEVVGGGSVLEHHTLAAPSVAVVGSLGWFRIPSRGLSSRTVKRVSVSAGDVSFLSGTTSLAVAGVAVSLTNTVAASDTHATASGAGVVDTSLGDAWVEVTCSAAGGHGNLSIEIEVE